MQYNTVVNNGGAGIFVGAGNVASYNILKDNSQYGFQAYGPDGGESSIVLDHNEIVGKHRRLGVQDRGCSCTGGGKFWDVRNVRVTNNYVHDNSSVALWADTNDNNFLFEGNWIENNDGHAIFWEISYNAAIRNNVIRHNLTVVGPKRIRSGDNFPDAAIYISESGGDARLPHDRGQPDHRHLEQPDRGQLQRRDALGERRPLLRLGGEHLDRLLHPGEPVGRQALELHRRQHRQAALLLRLPLEDPERRSTTTPLR